MLLTDVLLGEEFGWRGVTLGVPASAEACAEAAGAAAILVVGGLPRTRVGRTR